MTKPKRGSSVESAVERIRVLNERIVAAARQGGAESLKTYERMLENLAEAQEAAGERGADWIRGFGRAQAAFTRQLADAFPALLQRLGGRGKNGTAERQVPVKPAEKPAAEKPAEKPAAEKPAVEKQPSAAGADELPIPGYDELTVREVLGRLPGLSPAELSKLDAHEAHTKNRKTVRDKIRSLRG